MQSQFDGQHNGIDRYGSDMAEITAYFVCRYAVTGNRYGYALVEILGPYQTAMLVYMRIIARVVLCRRLFNIIYQDHFLMLFYINEIGQLLRYNGFISSSPI